MPYFSGSFSVAQIVKMVYGQKVIVSKPSFITINILNLLIENLKSSTPYYASGVQSAILNQ